METSLKTGSAQISLAAQNLGGGGGGGGAPPPPPPPPPPRPPGPYAYVSEPKNFIFKNSH